MKIKLLMLSVLLSFFAFAAEAQVMDMRAYSRQRGFKAYQPHQSQVQQRSAAGRGGHSRSQGKKASSAGSANEDAGDSSNVTDERKVAASETKKSDQTEEMQKYIADNPQVKPDI